MKNFIYILFLSLVSTTLSAQKGPRKNAEVGFFLGGSYYIGDLNPTGHFKFTKPAAGLLFRYNINPRMAVRATVLFGSLEAHDSYSSSLSQKQRNLDFKSPLDEFSVQYEFNFFDYHLGNEKQKFSPYIFLGIGAFHFNPKGMLNSSWVDLQPLTTEGQGLEGGSRSKNYKLTQISIPFGVGFKTTVSRKICLSMEWGLRKTFTDYLDDVSTKYYSPAILAHTRGQNAALLSDPSIGTDPNYSNVGRQRGNPTTKDWYAFAGILLSIKLKERPPKCPVAL